MPITALRHIRRMRGGAQAHLLEADDGHFYVVKFRNNPQHHRVLVNELLAAAFLDYLQIAAPACAVIQVTASFLEANPDMQMQVGGRTIAVEPGWHFASRYPGDPALATVYDFLPDALLARVANLEDFRAILVFDKWTGNADGRQSVFFRAMVRQAGVTQECLEPQAGLHSRPSFVARMIDHGYAFNGPHWDFPESPIQGLYSRPLVYRTVRSLDDFQPWLDQVIHFPEAVVDRAWKRIPADWIAEEEDSLEHLLEELLRRRPRLPDLINASRSARTNPFPNWS
jgi:hypothetical protein